MNINRTLIFFKRKSKYITGCLLLLSHWFAPLSILAQEKKDTTVEKISVMVETNDGSRFVGKLMARQDDVITLQTRNMGLMYIPVSQIKSIEEVGNTRKNVGNSDTWHRNPYAVQGLIFPTAFGLERGEGYYQNTMVGFNRFNYGMTDHFSVGGGLEIISLFAGGKPSVVFIEPKISHSIGKNFHLAVGAYMLFSSNFESAVTVLPFSTFSIGNRDNNFTLGGYIPTTRNGSPLILIGGQVRTGRKFGFTSELHLVDGEGFLIFGGRYIGESFGLNFGLFRFIGSDSNSGLFTIPYVGFTLPFGHKYR